MEYIQGETLGALMLQDMEQAESYISTSIEMQLEIHNIVPEAIETMRDRLYRQIKSVNKLNNTQKSLLLNELNSIKYENRLCHGDFHLFNLIRTDDRVVVIDWVDASAGDIRADVYRTYLLYSYFSGSLADMYLRLYCEKSGVLKSEVLKWAPIIVGARLAENTSFEESERLIEIVNQFFLA